MFALSDKIAIFEENWVFKWITTAMIKIYGMKTCPDCTYVEEQVKGNNQFESILETKRSSSGL